MCIHKHVLVIFFLLYVLFFGEKSLNQTQCHYGRWTMVCGYGSLLLMLFLLLEIVFLLDLL